MFNILKYLIDRLFWPSVDVNADAQACESTFLRRVDNENRLVSPNDPDHATGLYRTLEDGQNGTLKRGFWNYNRFCRSVPAMEDPVVRGRFFETPSGILVLQVPEAHILDHGTTDPLADIATQAHVTTSLLNPEPDPDRLPESATGAPWGPLHGELLAFDDPETRLPAIDRLEGFQPGGPCLYRRVLVPVRVSRAVVPACLSVVGACWTGGFKELTDEIWR